MTFGVAVERLLCCLTSHRCGERGHIAPQPHADANVRVGDDVAVPVRRLAEAGHDDVLIGPTMIDDLEHRVAPRPALAADVFEKQHAMAEQKAETEFVQVDRRADELARLQYLPAKVASSAHTCRG